MNERLRFHRLVPDDLAVAIRWYDEISPNLANRFRTEIDATFDRISANPQMYAQDSDGLRYTRVGIFPYLIQYRTEGSTTLIVGVYHSSSDPEKWRDRARGTR
jgi:plasmid stabilization system protein ParE